MEPNIKDIRNLNNEGEFHGYQELYVYNLIYVRGNFKNDEEIGYQEWHTIKETEYYIK